MKVGLLNGTYDEKRNGTENNEETAKISNQNIKNK